MARQIVTTLIDDIDGTEARETIMFGLDGVGYSIDLSDDNAERLREFLADFVTHARKVGRMMPRSSRLASDVYRVKPRVDREQNQAIRDWARAHGIKVADRGRIPADVVERFHQHNAEPPKASDVEPPKAKRARSRRAPVRPKSKATTKAS
jgi:hypothetical protein